MVNATHHQRGAGCSTTPEMRSVSQLKLRRFKTSGARAISRSASLISGAAGAASIDQIANCQLPIADCDNRKSKIENRKFIIPVPSPPSLRRRCPVRLASSDLDYEYARDNWFARQRSNNQATDNCGPALLFLKRDFLGL